MMRVIVAFGRERPRVAALPPPGRAGGVDARVDLTVRQTLFSLVVTMTTAVGSALVLGFGAYSRAAAAISAPGELLVVMGYVAALYKPLEQISNTVSGLQEQFITLRGALEPARHRARDPRAAGRASSSAARSGHVTFERRQLQLRRPRAARSTTSRFDAPPGTRVAIVGPTGAGKSTLLSLIPALLRPAARPRAARRPRRARPHARLAARAGQRRAAGAAAVLGHARATTSATAASDASDEEVSTAASAANAHDFIDRAAARLRHHARRARRAAVRRRAPAHLRRARVPARTRRS